MTKNVILPQTQQAVFSVLLGNITQRNVSESKDPVLQIAHTIDLDGHFLFSEMEVDKFLDAFVNRFQYVVEPCADRNLVLLKLASVPGNRNINEIIQYELQQIRRSLASGFHNIALQMFLREYDSKQAISLCLASLMLKSMGDFTMQV